MNFRSKNGEGRQNMRIDITPMIDVVFLLIIFLLLSTTFKKIEHAFKIVLPKAANKEVTVKASNHTILISGEGKYYFLNMEEGDSPEEKKEPLSVEQLSSKIKELKGQTPNPQVFIRASKEAKYQFIIDVLSLLNVESITNIQLSYERISED